LKNLPTRRCVIMMLPAADSTEKGLRTVVHRIKNRENGENGVAAWLRNFPHIWAENYRFIYAQSTETKMQQRLANRPTDRIGLGGKRVEKWCAQHLMKEENSHTHHTRTYNRSEKHM